ncbi:hypothetical protein CAMRE0001_3230 [Campylobacter rectus RM3267]|uniref:Uncharacterized protein n=1 Tax=Campylobacter rectus RM3267 TaxID=553218 RepID=B9D4Y8_CAMRE|nr:hypothetical protein CAMRE0001_3230 [Campylobacter rectus RM3267]
MQNPHLYGAKLNLQSFRTESKSGKIPSPIKLRHNQNGLKFINLACKFASPLA